MNKLTSFLETLFAEQDAKVTESTVQWAFDRVSALKEFKASDEYVQLNKKGAWGGVYDKLFAIAGGKTWYNLFEGRSKTMIEDAVRKSCKLTNDKRNIRIIKKLEKAGVTEITGGKVVYSNDGFNGVYEVNDKLVVINSILAGGVNIQCLHQRVLVNVK